MRRSLPVAVLGLLLLLGCAGAPLPPERVSPAGMAVRIGTADPAPGLVELGPIEIQNGSGCGLYGRRGTYEGAYASLRNQAAARGATYVKVTEQVGPHQLENCSVNAFIIRGLLYAGTPMAVSGGEAADGTCNPPCSPGYACQGTACIALCNPPCSPGYGCAQDRTCQPLPPPAVATPPP